MYAVEQGHHQIVEYLVSLGAKVDFDCQMFYPLMACFNKPYLNQDDVSCRQVQVVYFEFSVPSIL
jgi:hypothetical protein